MLKAHCDKEIVVAAYREFKKDFIRNSREFLDFLREGSDLVLYGKPNQNEYTIFSDFLQGRPKGKINRVDSDVLQNFKTVDEKNPYQVFFINTTESSTKLSLRKSNRFLYGFTDDYKEQFKLLTFYDFRRVGDVTSKYEFSGYTEILPDLPVTDVIITDPYLFDEDEGQKPIEENFYKLVDDLHQKYRINSLLVFSARFNYDQRNEVISETKKILGIEHIYIYKYVGLREHDRYIFMNYHMVNAGGSLNPFNEEGEVDVSSTSKIEVLPILQERIFIIAQEILRKLYEEVQNQKDNKRIAASISNRLFYLQSER